MMDVPEMLMNAGNGRISDGSGPSSRSISTTHFCLGLAVKKPKIPAVIPIIPTKRSHQ
jgi:hypothetical protein